MKSATLKTTLAATRATELSPPGTTESARNRPPSQSDFHSTNYSRENQKRNMLGTGTDAPSSKDGMEFASPAGRMLDSDGFEVTPMDEADYENLTLEEKILCGFYTAKPSVKGAYPIA